jgi:hypothetical protein
MSFAHVQPLQSLALDAAIVCDNRSREAADDLEVVARVRQALTGLLGELAALEGFDVYRAFVGLGYSPEQLVTLDGARATLDDARAFLTQKIVDWLNDLAVSETSSTDDFVSARVASLDLSKRVGALTRGEVMPHRLAA